MDIKVKDIVPLIGTWFAVYQGDAEIDVCYDDHYKEYADRKVISIFSVDSSIVDIGIEIF